MLGARHRDGPPPEAVTVEHPGFTTLEHPEMVRPRRDLALPIPVIEAMPERIRIGAAVIGAVVARIIPGADIGVVDCRYLAFIGRPGIEARPGIDRTLVHHIIRRKSPDLD